MPSQTVDPSEKEAVRDNNSYHSSGTSKRENEEPSSTTQMPFENKKEAQDKTIVDWDGSGDPVNPQNWSPLAKWGNLALVSASSLLVPIASSMFAPGVPQLVKEFDVHSDALSTFVVTVFLLGFAAGPLVLAPLSELYGRVIVYHVGNVGFIIFTVACAVSSDMSMLIGFRFLAGLIGAAPLTVGAGTIVDVFTPAQRSSAIALWSLGTILGPSIGPVAGGFLAQTEGWRWIFWVLAIAYGVVTIISFICLRETYAKTLLARKTKRLIRETGDSNLRSKLASPLSPAQVIIQALVRPAKLLVLAPICLLLSIFYAFVYSILYLLFSTFTFVFEGQYGFSQGISGLVFIGCGVGMFLGLAVQWTCSDRLQKHFAAKYNGGEPKPEYRLPLLIIGGPFISAGMFIYGWTAQYHVHWIVPIIGTSLVGFGITPTFMSINTYLIETYTIYAASAMAANTVLRSVCAAVIPLAALQMYNALGLGWGNSLLGFIALGMYPMSLFFWFYGEKLRTHPKLQLNL